MKQPTVIEVTTWADPNEVTLDSCYGKRMTHREWCERLIAELNADDPGRVASIKAREDGFIEVVREKRGTT